MESTNHTENKAVWTRYYVFAAWLLHAAWICDIGDWELVLGYVNINTWELGFQNTVKVWLFHSNNAGDHIGRVAVQAIPRGAEGSDVNKRSPIERNHAERDNETNVATGTRGKIYSLQFHACILR